MRRIFGLVALLALIMTTFATPTYAASSSIVVSPTSIYQGEYIDIWLTGFSPDESVSFWLTLPDFSVQSSGDLTTDEYGNIDGYIFISVDMPVGIYDLSARGNRSGIVATTAFEVMAAEGAPASPNVLLTVDSESLPQGECFDFLGSGYNSEEKISVWLRMPDGSVSSDGLETEFRADPAGGFDYYVCFGNKAAEGTYAFTAYGNSSNRTGIVEFDLERGDYLAAPNAATLIVVPKVAEQLDTVTIIGDGFTAGELVSLWITLPNGVVLDLFSGYTLDGSFEEDIVLPPLAVGTHYISAYGSTSGLRAVAELELLPGDGN